MEPRFLTRKQVCDLFRISESTLNRAVKAGQKPFDCGIRISPRRVIFPISIIDQADTNTKTELQTLASASL
jgi:predicted DNA-binding transcriptional regulator AlpA